MSSAVWTWLAIVVAGVWLYYLYKQGKIPSLKGKSTKLPKVFEPKVGTQIAELKAQTAKEVARAVELRGVLTAKRELIEAQAANTQLRKEIDSVTEKNILKKEPVMDKTKSTRHL